VEVPTLGHPESNLVIPVIAVDSHSSSLVVTTLSHYGTVLFFAVWGELDEASSKLMLKIPDVRRHF
jgi:hypothetical protein